MPIPSARRARCDFCGEDIDITAPGTHQWTSGWVKLRAGGGGHGISCAVRTNRWAHSVRRPRQQRPLRTGKPPLMLTEEQQRARAGKIGASFVPALMAADIDKILREWMRLVGHPAYEPEDLSRVWAVIMGNLIEGPALDYHEGKTKHPLTRRGEWVPHPERDYIGSTLDAFRDADRTNIDCKWMSRFRPIDEARLYYTGQLVVQKACTKADRSALLVVYGGDEPAEYEATWDEDYERQVWERIDWFWQRVETLQPPSALPVVKAPVPIIRRVDMAGNNEWAAHAGAWLQYREPAALFAEAIRGIKGLVEADVKEAYGHGISAKRTKNGAVTIKEA